MRTFAVWQFLWMALLAAVPCAAGEKIAVIVNSGGPLVSLTERDVRDIYLGDKRFEGGTRIVPINYAESTVKDTFISLVVNLSPKQYKLHWTKKTFQEGVPAPVIERRSADVIRAVSREKGGIGYIPAKETAGLSDSGVRILIEIGP